MHIIRHLYTFLQFEFDPDKRKQLKRELERAVKSVNIGMLNDEEKEELRDICKKLGIEIELRE